MEGKEIEGKEMEGKEMEGTRLGLVKRKVEAESNIDGLLNAMKNGMVGLNNLLIEAVYEERNANRDLREYDLEKHRKLVDLYIKTR
jgi:hypothetical protein